MRLKMRTRRDERENQGTLFENINYPQAEFVVQQVSNCHSVTTKEWRELQSVQFKKQLPGPLI
jgi:hypothetical protein